MPATRLTAGLNRQLLSRGLSPRTVTLYEQTVRRADTWWTARGWALESADVGQVAEYLTGYPASWASRKLLRCALRDFWIVANHPTPPLAAIRVPPKPQGECKALEEDDSRILAKAARARGDLKGLAVALGLYAALRREEIAGLQWSAYDSAGGWLRIMGKGEKVRRIPAHERLMVLLDATARAGPYVFPGRFGGHVTPATIWDWCRQVSTEAGVPTISPHVTRHIALATSNDNNHDLRSTQAFAGHSNPAITSIYTRTTTKRLRAVVDSLDY